MSERTHHHFLEPWAPHELALDYEYRQYHDRKKAGGFKRLDPRVHQAKVDDFYVQGIRKRLALIECEIKEAERMQNEMLSLGGSGGLFNAAGTRGMHQLNYAVQVLYAKRHRLLFALSEVHHSASERDTLRLSRGTSYWRSLNDSTTTTLTPSYITEVGADASAYRSRTAFDREHETYGVYSREHLYGHDDNLIPQSSTLRRYRSRSTSDIGGGRFKLAMESFKEKRGKHYYIGGPLPNSTYYAGNHSRAPRSSFLWDIIEQQKTDQQEHYDSNISTRAFETDEVSSSNTFVETKNMEGSPLDSTESFDKSPPVIKENVVSDNPNKKDSTVVLKSHVNVDDLSQELSRLQKELHSSQESMVKKLRSDRDLLHKKMWALAQQIDDERSKTRILHKQKAEKVELQYLSDREKSHERKSQQQRGALAGQLDDGRADMVTLRASLNNSTSEMRSSLESMKKAVEENTTMQKVSALRGKKLNSLAGQLEDERSTSMDTRSLLDSLRAELHHEKALRSTLESRVQMLEQTGNNASLDSKLNMPELLPGMRSPTRRPKSRDYERKKELRRSWETRLRTSGGSDDNQGDHRERRRQRFAELRRQRNNKRY